MITTGTVRALSDAALADRYAVSYQLVVAAYRTGSEPDAHVSADFSTLSDEQIRRLIERKERAYQYYAARGNRNPRA
jgi:hypothetical protein